MLLLPLCWWDGEFYFVDRESLSPQLLRVFQEILYSTLGSLGDLYDRVLRVLFTYSRSCTDNSCIGVHNNRSGAEIVRHCAFSSEFVGPQGRYSVQWKNNTHRGGKLDTFVHSFSSLFPSSLVISGPSILSSSFPDDKKIPPKRSPFRVKFGGILRVAQNELDAAAHLQHFIDTCTLAGSLAIT